MPKFTLSRLLDPAMTRGQLDGMALATIATLSSYIYRGGDTPQTSDHGLRWIRTYWQPGGTWGLCLYEAPDIATLADFQDVCGVPYVAIAEVTEIEGDGAAGGPDTRVAVTVTLPGGSAIDPQRAIDDLVRPKRAHGSTFVRAYLDPCANSATAVYRCADLEAFERGLPGSQVTQIVELAPDDYR